MSAGNSQLPRTRTTSPTARSRHRVIVDEEVEEEDREVDRESGGRVVAAGPSPASRITSTRLELTTASDLWRK